MSKIVKYCNSCEEGFAEKFGFCPNCGNQLQAFEMNPLTGPKEIPITELIESKSEASAPAAIIPEVKPVEAVKTALVLEKPAEIKPETPKPIAAELSAPKAEVKAAPTAAEVTPVVAPIMFNEPKAAEPVKVKPVAATEKPKSAEAVPTVNASAKNADAWRTFADGASVSAPTPTIPKYQSNGEFYVTVIEEKNVKQRNMLLLGALMSMVLLILAGTVYSLFAKDYGIASIDQSDLIASVPDVVPVPVDELPPPKKSKDDGGGGGGGGKQEETDTSKGRLPPQVKDPVTPPNVNITRMDNPAIPIVQATKGDNKRPITDENTGLPNGLAGASNGKGFGGGIGNGTGTGAGNGRGTGEGNGIGSGSGNGNGPGNGNGTGVGGDRNPPPPPQPKPVGPSKGVNILSKPRANYTDSARTSQIQGTVTLRVTFLASGQIGSISPVSGLPNGLTEQAIAAARGIRFEPAMKDGVAQTVTKQVQYSFTIY